MSCLQASYSTKNGHSSSINISKTASGNASIYLQKKKNIRYFLRFLIRVSSFFSLSFSLSRIPILLHIFCYQQDITFPARSKQSKAIAYILFFLFLFFFSIYSLLHHPLSHALSLSFFLSLSHAFIHSLSLAQSLSADIDKQTYYFIGTYTH